MLRLMAPHTDVGSVPLDLSPAAAARYLRTDLGRKTLKYVATSAIAIVVNQTVLALTFGLLHWSAFTSNVVAVCASTVPSYFLNRMWVWGRSGKSHLWREVVPFWAIAFFGLAFSTWAATLGEGLSEGKSRLAQTVVVNLFSLGSYAITWVGKFVLFNKVLFAHRHPHPAATATSTAA